MIVQLLKRRMLPERLALRILQAVVFACAVLIVGYGFTRMALLELTEAQWLLGLAIIIALVLLCIILLALINLRLKDGGSGTR